ncbi:mandelate racemase/muconate lactonizing enzyme family protein [Arthrobacter sp. FW306-2-2C-D06B]|uniref:mandelate racemase/muconate lactonizing enzyme family protein n=1 Tax=Arthrobacter sp. FW306-2-2C-D06B TaxID=2879618 RepID=UPI001F2D5363|nr:enolase C-terminal domain-like protein [Arthrobacter sp. FW306-2-2C-D06B]UKA60420.1 enolase [Arthrobacter sp. FW306-2-2C-D06B]
MQFTKVLAIPFKLPLHHEIVWATGSISSAQHVLIIVETSTGIRGYAEAIPRPMAYGETVESIVAVINDFVRPALVGLEVFDRSKVAYALRNVLNNNSALGAVDTAIWDAIGKSLDVPVHKLLGGYTDRIAVSAVIGGGDADQMVREAQGFAKDYGIWSFKVKVGWDPKKDADLLLTLREALPEAHLCADANHGFTSAGALEFLHRTADVGLAWIEEPSPAYEPQGRVRVYNQSTTEILGDESCRDAGEVVQETLSARSSMVSIKIARTGITASERIRGFCEAHGTGLVIGNQGDSALGTWTSAAYAAANRSTSENPAEMAYFLHIADEITNTPEVKDGYLTVSPEPGFGFTIDTDKLQKFASHPHLADSDLQQLLAN